MNFKRSARLFLGLGGVVVALSVAAPSAQDGGALVPAPATSGPAVLDAPAILGGDTVPDILLSGDGSVPVRILSGANQAELGAGNPFPGFGGGARTAAGDLNGDGVADIVTGMGPGGSLVQLFDGVTIAPLGAGYPFGPGFGGGVFVAVGDLNGDNRNDIFVSQGPGGGTVRVFNGIDYSVLANLTPFGAGYGGGVTLAAGDVNGDGRPDIIAGQMSGGLATAIDGATLGTIVTGAPFGGGFAGGVNVAAGDVNGDGRADVILAPGSGPGPVVVYDLGSLAQITNFFPYGGGFSAGIRVAAADITGDGMAEILTGPGVGGGTAVQIVRGGTFTLLTTVTAYPAGYQGGVLVSATAVSGLRFASANNATFTVGQAGSFTVQTAGLPPATSITQSGSLPAGVTFTDNGNGTATLAGTPAAPGGSFPLTFTASNGVTPPVAQNFTLTVQQAPSITSAAATTFSLGAAGSFTVTTAAFPAATVSMTGALPAGVTFTPGSNGTATLAGTPGETGSFPLTITAANGVSPNATQNFVLTVTGLPVFTSGAATTFTVGAAGSFQVTTIGSPTATLTRTGTLPAGVAFVDNGNGTATLSGTPASLTGGSYPLVITATNTVGSTNQNFTLTVNQPPVITSAAGVTFQTTVAGSFTVTTTGFPTATVSSTGSLPSGVSFTPNPNGTATLAGTPAAGTQGSYPLTLSATNGAGAPATQNFVLTVSACAGSMTPAGPALATGSVGTPYAQAFVATAPGSSGFSYAVTSGALPGGLTLSAGGSLSGTPNQSGNFAFTITATPTAGCTVAASYTLTITPNAVDESFLGGVGNTQYSVGAGTPPTPAVVVAGSVLSNDLGTGLIASPASIASTNGGQVTMNASGTFLYTPAAGFAGPSDTFTYTATDSNGLTDTAVVTINLVGLVWYVDDVVSAGDGRSNSPFNSLAAAVTAATTGQNIYVHEGTYTGAVTLGGEVVRGAGLAFTIGSLSLPAGTNPVLNETLTLTNGSAVHGLTVHGNASPAIAAGGALTTTATLNAVSISGGASGLTLTGVPGTITVTGGTFTGVTAGAEVLITGGTGAAAIGAAITNTGGRAIDVQSRTAGTVTFSGAIADTGGTGTGIYLNNNTGATIAFTGGMALSTGANAAFTATGGGTVTATQDNTTILNTLATTTGTALRVEQTRIGTAGLTFRSINAGLNAAFSAGNAVVLDTTCLPTNDCAAAGNGSFAVVGNGPPVPPSIDPTGGRIQFKGSDVVGADNGSTTSGIGIYLNATKNPTLQWVHLRRFSNSAIAGRNVAGFLIENSLIDSAGDTAGVNEGPVVFGLPNPGGVNGLVGAGTIRDTVINEGIEDNASFFNQSGTMSLTIERSVSAAAGACLVGTQNLPLSPGRDGLVVRTEGTASASVTVNRCRFRNDNRYFLFAHALDDSALTLLVTGSPTDATMKTEFARGSSGQGLQGVRVINGDNADAIATIEHSTFTGLPGSGIYVGQEADATSTSLLSATIRRTAFPSLSPAPPATTAPRIHAQLRGVAAPTVLVLDENGGGVTELTHVNQYGLDPGILIETSEAGSTPLVDITLDENHVDMQESNPPTVPARGPIGLHVRATYGSVCASVVNNVSHFFPTLTDPQGGGITLEQVGTATFNLWNGGLGGGAQAVLDTLNPSPSGTVMIRTVVGTVNTVANGTSCIP